MVLFAGFLVATTPSFSYDSSYIIWDHPCNEGPGASDSDIIWACTRLIDGGEARAERYYRRAKAYLRQGEFDLAISDIDKMILDSRGLRDDALCVRGLARAKSGDYERGIADLDEAIGIIPTVRAYATRGLIYKLRGDKVRAKADFGTARLMDASGAEGSSWQRIALQQLAELEQATPGAPPTITPIETDAGTMARPPSSPPETKVANVAPPATASVAKVPRETPQSPVGQGKRIALIIGNSAYRSVNALRNPEADSKIVAEEFRRLGFAEVIEKHDLSLADLSSELKSFGDKAEDADWAVVYYAGHGIEVAGINYVIPIDAELKTAAHVEDEAIPLDRLLSKVEGARVTKC